MANFEDRADLWCSEQTFAYTTPLGPHRIYDGRDNPGVLHFPGWVRALKRWWCPLSSG